MHNPPLVINLRWVSLNMLQDLGISTTLKVINVSIYSNPRVFAIIDQTLSKFTSNSSQITLFAVFNLK